MEMKESQTIPTGNTIQIDEAEGEICMTLIQNFIRKGTPPTYKDEARCLCHKAARYVEYYCILNMRGFNQPLVECIEGEEYTYIMREAHEGICESMCG